MGWKKIFILSSWLLVFTTIAKAETWSIIADEFPPFTCVRCPDGGAGVKALRDALQTVNVEIVVTYLPFVHVLKEAKSQKYTGYLAWPTSVQPGYLIPTKPIFSSPLIFVETKLHPLSWHQLTDLKGKKIALHEGSGYYDEFMALIKKGVITGVTYPSDTSRIRLVAQGKFDGAIMDRHNALFYLKDMPAKVQKSIRVNENVLFMQSTYLVIHEKQKDKMEILEKALKNIDTQKVVDDYLKTYFSNENSKTN